ncbi:MAG TPA: glycosyltransferase family 87 protein [Vicinamibacterales bacterium]|nr:glycosyltransferase family 87 protein [Vicinamibacterales bacterium]
MLPAGAVRILSFVFLALSLYLARVETQTNEAGKLIDFDLYYYGGMAERSGSYTDTGEVLRLAGDAHRPVSADGVFGSPSLVGLVFQPLSFLDRPVAAAIFEVLAVVALAIAVGQATDSKWWPLWLGIAVISTSNIVAFTLGNFAIFTTALLIFAYGAFRKDHDRRGAVALGIAIAFKLYPIFLLLPLLMKRRMTAVSWTIGTTAILLAITPLSLGWSDTSAALDQAARISSYVHPWSDNDGLPGSVLRATGNQELAQWTTRLAMLAAGLGLWKLRALPLASLMAVAILFMHLAQGISWNTQYGVTLVALISVAALPRSGTSVILLGAAYLVTNGVLQHATYGLYGLPRGVPITIGLVLLAIITVHTLYNQPSPTTARVGPAPTQET